MAHESSAVCEGLHALLLGLGLRRGSKEICNLFNTFCEIELRLFPQTVAIGLGAVEELGIDVEEGVVLGVLGCVDMSVYQGPAMTCLLCTHV